MKELKMYEQEWNKFNIYRQHMKKESFTKNYKIGFVKSYE